MALTAAACSSGAGTASRSVASLPSSSHTGSTQAKLTQSQSDQDFIRFAQCLRAHGLNEPDPIHLPGHSGLSVEVPPRTTATAHALDACDHYIAREVQDKQRAAPPLSAQVLDALTAYAGCMRSHDIGMLDPGTQGELNLGNVPGITARFGRYSPQFRAADASCRHLLPAGVHDDGTGP